MNKQQALTQIASIAQAHNLTPEDITAHLLKQAHTSPSAKANLLVTMLSYLGGLLVFTGTGYFISLQWEHFDSLSRVLITFGPGLIAMILALATIRDPRFTRATTPLFLIGAFMQPFGLFTLLREYYTGNDGALAAIIVFTPLAAQMFLLFWKLQRTSLLFLALLFTFITFAAMMDKLDFDGDLTAIILGFCGLLITSGLNRTSHRAIAPFSYFIFAMMFATGCFALLDNSKADFLLIAIGGLMIFASIRAQSRSFLTASILTTLGYLCYFTNEYFADSLGWPLSLITLGLVMIGLSAWAVKLGRKLGTP